MFVARISPNQLQTDDYNMNKLYAIHYNRIHHSTHNQFVGIHLWYGREWYMHCAIYFIL